MTSILSGTNKRISYNNHTMTLRFNNAMNTTTGGYTVMIDEPSGESSNIEDMHYLLVNIEKMKRNMLCKVEGNEDPRIDYTLFSNAQKKLVESKDGKSAVLENSIDENSNLNVYPFE